MKARVTSIQTHRLLHIIRLAVLLVLGSLLTNCAHGNGKSETAGGREPQAVINRQWQWTATVTPVDKIVVLEPERYTILLKDDGKLEAMFDCNRGGGSYRISEGKLSFGPMISTRKACPPDSQDAVFMRDLQRVQSFFVENGFLHLELPLDSGTMTFKPAAVSQ